MVSANSNITFLLVNTATNPPSNVAVYANVTAARAQAANLGLTSWEIFFSTPKNQRPGAGGMMTGGSPNVVYKKRIERHGGMRSSPSFGIDDPGSAGGQTSEGGHFGV